jgi:hypothetical protein
MCKLTYLVLAILLSLAVSVHGADRLVPNVYPTIQAAIDAAVNGDTVIIADGTYTGVGNRDIDFADKAITVKSQNGPGLCIIDCQNYGDGFRFDSGEPNSSVLDGITITNCNNGIIISNSNPTIRNCNISTFYWTGISCESGSVQISNCKIKYGYGQGSSYQGINLSNSSAVISSSDITDNYSRGITAQNSRLEMDNCVIARNTVYGISSYGGGGGGICFSSYSADPNKGLILSHCSITNNTSIGLGGHMEMMCMPPGCMPGIDPGCMCQPFFTPPGSAFGGGICFAGYGEFQMFNCLVTENIAQSGSDPLCQPAQAYGGGIYISGSPTELLIQNCTIANNQATRDLMCLHTPDCDGGGVYVSSGSTCQILNSIIWGNTVSRENPEEDLNYQITGNVTIDYTVVQNGGWSVDPRFAQGGPLWEIII